MRGHFLGMLECAAIGLAGGAPGGTEGAAADRRQRIVRGIELSNLRNSAPPGTGVLPVLTKCFDPRTAAGLVGSTWRVISLSNSIRTAARCSAVA